MQRHEQHRCHHGGAGKTKLWHRYPIRVEPSMPIARPEPAAAAGLRLLHYAFAPGLSSTTSCLAVFCGHSVAYLEESLGWNHAVGFALMAAGAAFVFTGRT